MNRRSFLSSLAALSLPAVVAGKVGSAAPPIDTSLADWCDCNRMPPMGWTEPYHFTDPIVFNPAPTRWLTVEQACEEFALPLSHFRPNPRSAFAVPCGTPRSCTVTPTG